MSDESFVLVINKNEAGITNSYGYCFLLWPKEWLQAAKNPNDLIQPRTLDYQLIGIPQLFLQFPQKLRVGKGFYSWQKLITLSLLSIGHIYSLDTCSLQEVRGLGRGPGWRERCVAAKPLYRRSRLNTSSHIYFLLIFSSVVGALTRPSIIIGWYIFFYLRSILILPKWLMAGNNDCSNLIYSSRVRI